MSAEILSESSRVSEESKCEVDNSSSFDESNIENSKEIEQISPVEESEILPFSMCESIYPDCDKDNTTSSSETFDFDKQINACEGLQAASGCGKYTINNHMYERERQRFYASTGETVMYLRCSKAKKHGCRKARAVLVMDREGTVRVRKCAESEEHTHPPPIEDVFKTKVKTRLKAMIRAYPEKSARELYEEVIKEEYDSYAKLDPDFGKKIPTYEGVRTFIHRERSHMKEEAEVRLALIERGEQPVLDGKALRTKWKRITGELPMKIRERERGKIDLQKTSSLPNKLDRETFIPHVQI